MSSREKKIPSSLSFFYKIIVFFPTQAAYSSLSANFRLKIIILVTLLISWHMAFPFYLF